MKQDELSKWQDDVMKEIEENDLVLSNLVTEQRGRQSEMDRLRRELRGLWVVHRGLDACIEKASGHPIGLADAISEIISNQKSERFSSSSMLNSLQNSRHDGISTQKPTISDIEATLERLEKNKEIKTYKGGGPTLYTHKHTE